MKYYAVKVGKVPGVYTTWDQCKEQVNGFKGAKYKSFPTLEEANAFITGEVPQVKGLVAYVDGSYNQKTKVFGYGAVILDNGKIIHEISNGSNKEEFVEMRNVAGEIYGSLAAIKYAISKGYKSITIYYDYKGIEMWADGKWKTNKEGTKMYAALIQKYRRDIEIKFVKVAAHTGVEYNEAADLLAKKGAGVVDED